MPYLDHYISNTQSDRTSDKDQKIWDAEVGEPQVLKVKLL